MHSARPVVVMAIIATGFCAIAAAERPFALVLSGSAAQKERLFCALRLGLPRGTADALRLGPGGEVRTRRALSGGRAATRLGAILAGSRPVEVRLVAPGTRPEGVDPRTGKRTVSSIALSFPAAPGLTLLARGDPGAEEDELVSALPSARQVLLVEAPLGTQVTTLAHELLTHVYLAGTGRPAGHRALGDAVDLDARASEDDALRALRRRAVFTPEQRAAAAAAWEAARSRLLAGVPEAGRERAARLFAERFPAEAFLEGGCR